MSGNWAETCRRTRLEAKGRFAYCRMHQSLQGATFHVEHVVPASEGGSDDLENTCLACPGCNLHKSNRTSCVDPATATEHRLFHPKKDDWSEHFFWVGTELLGKTPIGRATIHALQLDSERRRRIRSAEGLFDLFPPKE